MIGRSAAGGNNPAPNGNDSGACERTSWIAGSTEFCHFLSGKVEMTHPDGTVQVFGPGDAITLPQGWKGIWHVVEHVRKIYVITLKDV